MLIAVMGVDYNKLKYFITAVRCQSVTRASIELHRTQSAVTQAIQSLERQLGVALITWDRKQMQLTRAGRALYDGAKSRFEAIDEQLHTLKNAQSEVSGTIEIGLLNDQSTSMQKKLYEAISSFRLCYPAVRFGISLGTSAEIENGLLQHTLDMGFLINIQSLYRFHLFEVTTERHIVVSSPLYLQRYRPITTVHDVISADLIDIDTQFTCFTPWVKAHDVNAFSQLQQRTPTITVPDFLAIRTLLLSGQGIAVMPKYLIEEELKNGAIIQLLPELLALRVWVHCAIEQSRELRLAEKLFITHLKQRIEEKS